MAVMKRRLREAHGKLASAIFSTQIMSLNINEYFLYRTFSSISLSMQNPRQSLSQLISSALVSRGRAERNGIWEATLPHSLFPSPLRKHARSIHSAILASSHLQRTSLSCCHHDPSSDTISGERESQPLTLAHFPPSTVDVNNI